MKKWRHSRPGHGKAVRNRRVFSRDEKQEMAMRIAQSIYIIKACHSMFILPKIDELSKYEILLANYHFKMSIFKL